MATKGEGGCVLGLCREDYKVMGTGGQSTGATPGTVPDGGQEIGSTADGIPGL